MIIVKASRYPTKKTPFFDVSLEKSYLEKIIIGSFLFVSIFSHVHIYMKKSRLLYVLLNSSPFENDVNLQ